jgi:hypothetical protein
VNVRAALAVFAVLAGIARAAADHDKPPRTGLRATSEMRSDAERHHE